MTFSSQLRLLLLTVILLMLVIALSFGFYTSRQHIENQLALHAQDVASSLGLSTAAMMKTGDNRGMASLVDAMLHAGDFREVVVYDSNGQELVKRHQDVNLEGIPDWLIQWVPFHLPIGEAAVMDELTPIGKVQVSSHPGYAYQHLWKAAKVTFKWFSLSAFIIMLAGFYQLWRLLRPLKQVTAQADSISHRESVLVEPLPGTPEFKQIAYAMNHLGGKVNQMLAESDQLAQKLRDQAHRDSVTGLANRQYFNEVLDHRIGSAEQMQQGALALIQIKDFKQFNDSHGYLAGDNLLRKTGMAIQSAVAGMDNVHIAHLSGASFAVLAEDLSSEGAERLAKILSMALTTLRGQVDEPMLDIGHVGIACYTGKQTSGILLSMADTALREAEAESANGWAVYQDRDNAEITRTATEWRHYIGQALEEDWLIVQRQPVFSTVDRSLLHEEIYVRLAENGNVSRLVNANAFMPMAHSLGLATAIDRRVIEKTLGILHAEQEGFLAVNVSPLSLDNSEFFGWLKNTLAENRQEARRLILEFPEYGVVRKLDKLSQLQQELAAFGVQLSLDHFGCGFTSFAYLQSIKLDFLKIDGSYLQDIESSAENRFFVHALTEIAHGLDITVVAESVENEDIWKMLSTLKVDAGQGYYLAKPS